MATTAAAAMVTILPSSLALARSGISMASHSPVLRFKLPSRVISNRAIPSVGSYSGLRKLSLYSSPPKVESRSTSSTWQQGHHECPHWLNPQAAWKQEILWTKVPVLESKRVAELLSSVKLDISNNEELKTGFTKPGQFVQVKIGTGKPAFLAIASTPKAAEEGVLEFLIKDVEGTTASEICALKEGSEVDISQVMGKGFPLEKLSPPDEFSTVLIFATGSGISPIRSVIEHGFDANKRADVRLYYGAGDLNQMAYQDRFADWEASGVKVIPCLSDPTEDWEGEKGFVQAAFTRSNGLPEPSHAGALLCGQKEMAEEVTAILTEAGISKDKILLNF